MHQQLQALYQQQIQHLLMYPVDIALLRAKITDHYHDMALDCPDPDVFQAMLEALDQAAQQRLMLLLTSFDSPTIKQAFQQHAQQHPEHLQQILLDLAIDKETLTLEYLQQSPLHLAELYQDFLTSINA